MCWQEFKRNPYKWLWTRIGGRPWTFILRDLWHKYEFIWIVLLVGIGIILGHYCGFRTILTIWISFALGYIAGHLFWGSDYVEGQQGE